MRKFFAFFRRLFAIDRAYTVLAEVVYDYIRKVYIPELKRQARNSHDSQEKATILALIEEYEKYADPSKPEGREFAEVTARVVGATATKYRNTGVVPEDAIQQIAGDFYALPRAVESMRKFDPKLGPVKLRNYWASILNLHSAFTFREEARKMTQKDVFTPGEEGEETVPLENIPEHRGIDMGEMLERMRKFVDANLQRIAGQSYKADVAREIFDLWYPQLLRQNSAVDYGPEEVRNDWEAMRKKEGKVTSRSGFYEGIKILKTVLRKFWEADRKYQRAAGKTVAERVAKTTFRVRFAKWMLGE